MIQETAGVNILTIQKDFVIKTFLGMVYVFDIRTPAF